ncbi:MAG: HIT family protein [bacterium]|nr:HIT family protein [bacterium]
MDNCIFCKIIKGDLPAEKIAENDDFIAILGIRPRYPGMTVIVSKKHFDSYLYQSMPDDLLSKMHVFVKQTALKIDKTLGSFRCVQIMEGFDVNHAHIKLFPCYKDSMYEAKYEGEDMVNPEELKKVADIIRNKSAIS